MKKWMIFGGGFLSGIFVCFLTLFVVGLASRTNLALPGATFFEQPNREIRATSFKVLQVIQDDAALVHCKNGTRGSYYDSPLYLLVNSSGHYYYDEEVIQVPSERKVVQVGIYKYNAKSGIEKTVPIVRITDR